MSLSIASKWRISCWPLTELRCVAKTLAIHRVRSVFRVCWGLGLQKKGLVFRVQNNHSNGMQWPSWAMMQVSPAVKPAFLAGPNQCCQPPPSKLWQLRGWLEQWETTDFQQKERWAKTTFCRLIQRTNFTSTGGFFGAQGFPSMRLAPSQRGVSCASLCTVAASIGKMKKSQVQHLQNLAVRLAGTEPLPFASEHPFFAWKTLPPSLKIFRTNIFITVIFNLSKYSTCWPLQTGGVLGQSVSPVKLDLEFLGSRRGLDEKIWFR